MSNPRLNFTERNLRQMNLSNINFVGARLKKAHLEGTILNGKDLTRAYLEGAYLEGAHLIGATLKDAYLLKADLKRADLTEATLTDAYLYDANLTGATLIRTDFTGANLTRADLRGATLTGVIFTGANLTGADLRGLDLREVNLEGVNLAVADLTGADLRGVNLDRLRLSNLQRQEIMSRVNQPRLSRLPGLPVILLEPRAQANSSHLGPQEGRVRRSLLCCDSSGRRQSSVLASNDLSGHCEPCPEDAQFVRALRVMGHEPNQSYGRNPRLVNENLLARRERLRWLQPRSRQVLEHFSPFHQRDVLDFNYPSIDHHFVAQRRMPRSSDFLIIEIPEILLKPQNSSNGSCPLYNDLYDYVLSKDLSDEFIFRYIGQNAIDAGGPKRDIFQKLLPVYTNKFFKTIQNNNNFIILKENIDISKFIEETKKMISLANAAKTLIFLKLVKFIFDSMISKTLFS